MKITEKYRVYLSHEFGNFFVINNDVSRDLICGLTFLVGNLSAKEVKEFNGFCENIDKAFKG